MTPPRAGSGSEPQAEVAPPPPRGLPLFLQQRRAWPGHAGAREVGGGKRGGPRRRRRDDRTPQRLTLLKALARCRLTPPQAAGWADEEGEWSARREAGGRKGPLMALYAAPATAGEAARLPGASKPAYEMHTAPRPGRLTR